VAPQGKNYEILLLRTCIIKDDLSRPHVIYRLRRYVQNAGLRLPPVWSWPAQLCSLKTVNFHREILWR